MEINNGFFFIMMIICLTVHRAPFETSLTELSRLSEVEYFRDTLTGQKTLKRAHIGEGPRSLNSITTDLYTIHKRQRCAGCSFQLLFPQIPIEISSSRTMHFFPFGKKRKKINTWFQYMRKPIDTIPGSLFLCRAPPTLFPPPLANGK